MNSLFQTSFMQSIKNLFAIDKNDSHTFLMKSALWIAMLSVLFERYETFIGYVMSGEYFISTTIGLMGVALLLFFHSKLHRTALVLFAICLLILSAEGWPSQANHSWLAVWIIAPTAILSQWWSYSHYQRYVRVTMGIVMIAAGMQKLVTHTYFDGSYITYLSNYGSISEQMFGFLCTPSTESCLWHAGIGSFLVVWQFVVGLLLITGQAGLMVLVIEISFLLGAGVFANEMNFQVLAISSLMIGFGYGMARWLAVVCVCFLIIDVISIGNIALMFIDLLNL